jgi:hypothetical protein
MHVKHLALFERVLRRPSRRKLRSKCKFLRRNRSLGRIIHAVLKENLVLLFYIIMEFAVTIENRLFLISYSIIIPLRLLKTATAWWQATDIFLNASTKVYYSSSESDIIIIINILGG